MFLLIIRRTFKDLVIQFFGGVTNSINLSTVILYLINERFLVLFLVIILQAFLSCRSEPIPCEAEFQRSNFHSFELPITIEPNQKTYTVGDTMHVDLSFGKDIYDSNAQQVYEIVDFPFLYQMLLYKFDDLEGYESGFRFNTAVIDSIYDPVYTPDGLRFVDNYTITPVYENEMYHFRFDLILEATGRYIFLLNDRYNWMSGSNPHVQLVYDYTWEGECGVPLVISTIIDGDNYLWDFKEELRYIDTTARHNDLGAFYDEELHDYLDRGSLQVDRYGYTGFEVVE